jgi:hypothetical protein
MRGALLALGLLAACAEPARPPPAPLVLEEWERGIAVRSLEAPDMDMYLWFYEWNLFDAFQPGQSSAGDYEFERSVAPDGRSARIRAENLVLELEVDAEGVALELSVTNPQEEPFGELAALVPCFSPGPPERRTHALSNHDATYYLGRTGLERATAREMHFNAALREALQAVSPELEFDFSSKWPTSDHDAVGGLLLRQSREGDFVTGIAWEDFLGAQAHNPWQCLHLSVRVGPLAPGATRAIRGRIWHFAGGREELLQRWRQVQARW